MVRIIPEELAVVIGTADELYGHRAELQEINWLTEPLRQGDECHLQIRYRARSVPAQITQMDGDRIELALAEPARAITPGQSGVMYRDERLLGGGILN